MRKVTAAGRRRLLVRRHHLAADAERPQAVVRALVALHATDPASVYLSVIARSATTALGDVASAMYERRSLVRWMAMRRTLFALGCDDIPIVQAAISTPLAEDLRWWTGWTKTTTRQVVQSLPVEEVDLHGTPGIDLVGATPTGEVEPTAALLPALARAPRRTRPSTDRRAAARSSGRRSRHAGGPDAARCRSSRPRVSPRRAPPRPAPRSES